MSASRPFRSAAPLAAAGICCLGLVPTLGRLDHPLHWAVAAGMVAFGGLLMLRHHLRASEGGLPPVASGEARQAGHTLLGIALIIAGLTAWIVVARWAAGGGIGALSLAMPALGLAWLGALGLRCLRHGGAQASVPGEVGRLGSLKAGMGPRLTHDDVNDDAGQRRARNLGGSREHLEREIQAE